MTQTAENRAASASPPVGARVVVVGAGFAGGSLLSNLPPFLRRPGETLLIDRAEQYAFIPLIHEVAVGRIHPDSALTPISPNGNASYSALRSEVTGVDLEHNTLLTTSGPIKYRYLVLAPGSVAAHPPGGLADHLQTFWSLEDALRLRSTLNDAWQTHLRERSPREETGPGGLTVAIVGGGATGVELAAEVSALFDYLKKRSARTPSEEPHVVLLEASNRLLGWLDPYFHEVAVEELAKIGVEVRLNSPVTAADEKGIGIEGGERIPAAVRVWATGAQANPLVRDLPGEHDDTGRARIDERLTLPGHPEVYVLGDSGVYEHPRLGPLPPTASVAVQQGPFVARDIERRTRGVSKEGRRPFEFFDRG
ncbi:MAG: FAD-dependent oxidoreductase, partial [Rubrobacteraceae bacterium]